MSHFDDSTIDDDEDAPEWVEAIHSYFCLRCREWWTWRRSNAVYLDRYCGGCDAETRWAVASPTQAAALQAGGAAAGATG